MESSSPLSSAKTSGLNQDTPRLNFPAVKRQRMSNGTHESVDSHTHNASDLHFKPGAIKRIRMIDFMTYQDCEYHLWPALNMIIGANGTGKSSVIAAICLGLGFDAKIMGRAEAYEMVRHGCEAATVEIEIKAHSDHQEDPIIQRHWTRGDGEQSKSKTDWHISGKKVTHKAVMELVRSYRVQIDNLCQFLPQDKVKHFSALTPQQLLPQTLSTVGDGSRADVLRKLVEDQQKVVALAKEEESAAANLKTLEALQASAQNNVNLFLERKEFEKKIDFLKRQLPFARYNQIKREKEVLKGQVKEARDELRALRTACQPLETRREELENAAAKAKRMSDKAQRNHDAKLKQVTELSEPLKSIEDDMKDFQEKRKAEQRKQRERVEEKRKLRERVASDTQKLGNKPDVQEDVERITAEIVASNEASRDAKLEFDRLTRKIQELQDHVKRNDDQRGNKMGQLKKLSDVRTQRLNALRSINVDAAEAAEWLAKNQDKFDHPVAGPLFLDVEITDPKHKIAAGYTLQKHASMFVCASKKDYRTFNQLLVDGNAAGRPLRLQVSEYSETKAPTIQHHNQPLPSSALTQYGFDCYVLDCISGPDLLLNALCHVAKIHRLPVASQPLSPAKEQQVQDVKVQGQWVFDSYICGNYETRLLRRYNKFQTSSERIKEERTKWHSGGSGDVDVRSKMLEHEVLELTEAIDEASTSIDEMQPRHAMLKEKLQATSRKKSALASERDKYASHVKDWKKLNERLERARKNLEALENAPDTYQQILAEIKAQQRQAAEEAVTCALAVQVEMLQLVQLNEVFVLRQADMLQADANMRAFEEHTHALTQRAEQVEQRYAELKAAHTAVVAAAREAMTEATAMLANLSEEDSNMILGLDVNETEETINLRIGENKTLLSHISVQAGDTVEKFEERQKQIDEQKVANKRRKEKLDGARDAIQRVAEPFKLELEGMVRAISEQFAASFQAISGKGLVALVSPEDDYSKWALDIHVQFYETSGFNRLDGLRQSGGERAVSTVFFLMALQSLTTAPFRVVDEINQGMDPRNERLVHGRMVAASCEGDTVSQYFLITPKLLPGLKYHPYMKVHCVTSGNLGQRDNKMRGKRYLEALKQRAQQMQEV